MCLGRENQKRRAKGGWPSECTFFGNVVEMLKRRCPVLNEVVIGAHQKQGLCVCDHD